jgi:hypothetical protein
MAVVDLSVLKLCRFGIVVSDGWMDGWLLIIIQRKNSGANVLI